MNKRKMFTDIQTQNFNVKNMSSEDLSPKKPPSREDRAGRPDSDRDVPGPRGLSGITTVRWPGFVLAELGRWLSPGGAMQANCSIQFLNATRLYFFLCFFQIFQQSGTLANN